MRKAVVALAACAAAAACGRPARVKAGDRVQLQYELSAGGAVIESGFGDAPIAVTAGAGALPPGADAALIGMAAGEEKRVDLVPEAAFGARDPAKVQALAPSDLGALARGLKPGMKVQGFRDGKPETGVVLSTGARVTLDFNPPLAGKDVSYRLKVVAIER